MSPQTRSFGDKTFNAIGYGGMGLSIAYGAVGTDEERLKVQTSMFFSVMVRHVVDLPYITDFGCRL